MASPSSLDNVLVKWVPEIRHHCSDVPLILVGTKADLRDDKETVVALQQCGQSLVRREQALKVAHKMRAISYCECSALTQRGLKHVFEEAVKAVLSPPEVQKRKKCLVM